MKKCSKKVCEKRLQNKTDGYHSAFCYAEVKPVSRKVSKRELGVWCMLVGDKIYLLLDYRNLVSCSFMT